MTAIVRIDRVRALVAVPFLIVMAACGSSGGGSTNTTTPTTPTTPTATNHAPAITIASSAGFGISQQTTFTFTAATSDSDGDAVSVSWNFGDGTSASGTSATHVYASGGSFNVVATASDSKGASTPSNNVTVVAGSMTGNWSVNLVTCGTFNMTLSQAVGTVTGTFVMPTAFCAATAGSTGKTDPAEPGTIDGNGNVQIRLKVGAFLDFYIRGKMDSTGQVVNGGAFNSGFNGNTVTMRKQ
jgi:hypothetical protein